MRRVLLVLLLSLVPLSGCLDDDSPAAEPVAPGPLDTAVAGYLHDLSEPIPGISWTSPTQMERVLLEHYRVPAAGEIQLDTWVYRPDVEERVPLVLTLTPYYGGGIPSSNPALGVPVTSLAQELVQRGYAVGWSSVRGTGNSGGCFVQGGPQEAVDSAGVIQFLAQEPWSNGNVGMIGVSYDGTTPQETWVEAPEALKTIVPISGISDMYDYNFVNGVPINVQGFGFNTYYWGIVGLGPAGLEGGVAPTDPASVAGAAQGEACQDQVAVQEGGVSSTVDGDKDAYWQERDFTKRLLADPDRPRASVFFVHGLQDWNVKPHMMEHWLDAVQSTGVPFKAWLGQWGHAWPQSSPGAECAPQEDGTGSACRHDWWNRTLVAWFDQFLKGRDTGVLDVPAVQVQDDDGVWRHEERWPPTDTAPHTWYPDAGGKLSGAPGSGSVSYYDNLGEVQGLAPVPVPVSPPALNGPTQAVFVSDPMPADWHVSGLPRFVANVTASGARASLMLTLAERLPDGTDRPFNFAAISLNHVDSVANGRPDIAGARQRVVVDFFPQDDVVHEGSRLVLIAAGNLVSGGQPAPGLQPVSTGSTITLDLAGSWLSLPVDHSLTPEQPQPYDAP